MKNWKKVGIAAVLCMSLLAGCGGNSDTSSSESNSSSASAETQDLSGSISAAGSSALKPLLMNLQMFTQMLPLLSMQVVLVKV